MLRRIVVLDEKEIKDLLAGKEINISFDKPLTKISLLNEKGYEILNNKTDRKLMEVKNNG